MRKHIVLIVLTVVVSLGIYYFRTQKLVFSQPKFLNEHHKPPTKSEPNQTPVELANSGGVGLTENDKVNLAKLSAAFSAPISFFGKVVDQNGQPVARAKVHYSAADRYFGDSSKSEGIADENGAFSVTGLKGAGLYVNVSKEGYDGTNQSGGSFGYGVPTGQHPPTQLDPAVFVLRKKAQADTLIAIDRDFVIPKYGGSVEVSLQTGKVVPRGSGDLRIELWVNDQKIDAERQYDWRFRLTVPGGGVAKRNTEDMQFEAPVDGYEQSVETGMSPNSTRWRDRFEDNYFVKLGNGTFARMRFRITAGGGHFASITSYLNPTPGSRNLEFDPAKQIKPK